MFYERELGQFLYVGSLRVFSAKVQRTWGIKRESLFEWQYLWHRPRWSANNYIYADESISGCYRYVDIPPTLTTCNLWMWPCSFHRIVRNGFFFVTGSTDEISKEDNLFISPRFQVIPMTWRDFSQIPRHSCCPYIEVHICKYCGYMYFSIFTHQNRLRNKRTISKGTVGSLQ